MNPNNDLVKKLLRYNITPVPDLQLQSDLWPRMLARIDAKQPIWNLWDWIAVAAAGAGIVALPASASLILYML